MGLPILDTVVALALAAGTLVSPPGPGPQAEACAALAAVVVAGADPLAATFVAARPAVARPAGPAATGAAADPGQPAHCLVRTTLWPGHRVHLHLPLPAAWSGASWQGDCAQLGCLGATPPPALLSAGLARGEVMVTSRLWPGSAADPGAAAALITDTARLAEPVIQAFYGRSAGTRLVEGCGAPAQAVLAAVARAPALFTGVLVGAPGRPQAIPPDTPAAPDMRAAPDTPAGQAKAALPDQAALERLHQVVVAACDAEDGLADGLIAWPERCGFDPMTRTCPATPAGTTAPAVSPDTEQAVSPDTERAGLAGVPPVQAAAPPPAGEAAETAEPCVPPALAQLAAARYGAGIPRGSELAWSDPHPLAAAQAALALAGAPAAGDATALVAYFAAGGRMVIWHGKADAVAPFGDTVVWLRGLERHDGVRLFLAPGIGHCRLAPAPGDAGVALSDPMAALRGWLAGGTAPEELTLTRLEADGTLRWTRPVCPWPLVARLAEGADPFVEKNWRCGAMPTPP